MAPIFQGPVNEGAILTPEAERTLGISAARTADQFIGYTPVGIGFELGELATNRELGPDPTDTVQGVFAGPEAAARPAGETPEVVAESSARVVEGFEFPEASIPGVPDVDVDVGGTLARGLGVVVLIVAILLAVSGFAKGAGRGVAS